MPEEVIKRDADEGKEEDLDHLESAMEELHNALQSKDFKLAAEIFRACQELIDSEPHVEGSHIKE